MKKKTLPPPVYPFQPISASQIARAFETLIAQMVRSGVITLHQNVSYKVIITNGNVTATYNHPSSMVKNLFEKMGIKVRERKGGG